MNQNAAGRLLACQSVAGGRDGAYFGRFRGDFGLMVMLRVSRMQAVSYRLMVNNLSTRLPTGSYVEAAYVGLQDTAPATRFWACTPA